jgi:hypothetical protein
MKKNLHINPILIKMALLITCFMLVMLYNQSKAAVLPTAIATSNRVTVNFINDAEKNELTIRVKSRTEAPLQLFIFSIDGILIKEVPVNSRQSTSIKSLKKGLYLFECFDKDERMKSGKLMIK